VGQCTTDLARAVRFYVELFGFEVERDLEIPDEGSVELLGMEPPLGLHAVYLRGGGIVLELLTFDRPGNPPRAERVMNEPGLTHLSLSVEAFDDVLERVPALGGEILSRLPAAAMVRDPDGQLLEILTMAYHDHVARSRAAAADGDG
jgi:catechol 2,3-dioxygenase-like lactoylglutathione lyase family enzyme